MLNDYITTTILLKPAPVVRKARAPAMNSRTSDCGARDGRVLLRDRVVPPGLGLRRRAVMGTDRLQHHMQPAGTWALNNPNN
jgi:hypothetical protein